MVLFMEGLDSEKVFSGHSHQDGVKETSTDEVVASVLQSLPFQIDRSLVYTLDEFELTVLGSGFFGDIYKAHHRKTDETMVLKKDKNSIDDVCLRENSLMTEADILSQINHPNVVRFLGLCLGNISDQVHLLIEYINGGNLEELLIRHEEVLDWGTRVHLAKDIADGVSHLHKSRIIHRDLSSKNCLIKDVNGVKYGIVADLGLATHIPDNDEGVQSAVGSPYNMAPELLRGECYDNKADVFSYGIIMCEIIGRVQADPDELPRTGSFGLDVEKFQTMVGDCPIEFLHTAVCCCQMDPKSRPSFSATVRHLDSILMTFPRRPELTRESPTIEKTITKSLDVPVENTLINNNSISCNISASSSNHLLTPTSKDSSHRVRTNSENRKRLSWISGRYKLFHSATDDLLKHTPAKLMGFFKNVLGVRTKDHSFNRTKKRSNSSSVVTQVSPLPSGKSSFWNHDSQTDNLVSPSDSLCLSKSCPGSPGTSGRFFRHSSSELRRHTIAPTGCTSQESCSDATDFPPLIHSESVTHSAQSDITSVSSGFDSMLDTSSAYESSSLFTYSDYSSRHSSLQRDPPLPEDDEDPTTTTCKNLKSLHFDRSGSYSVINAETSYRQEMEREMRKEKLDVSKESDNPKTRRRMTSPRLFSFLLGNRTKSKDQT